MHGRTGKVIAIAGAAIILDQLSKLWIAKTMELGHSICIVGSFLRLTYIHNPNGVFGMGLGGNVVHTVLSVIAFALITYMLVRTPPTQKGVQPALALILGGAVGNLIDRIWMGEVIDFIDVGIENRFRWPVFNVADSALTIGMIMLFIFHILDRNAYTDAADPSVGDRQAIGSASGGA